MDDGDEARSLAKRLALILDGMPMKERVQSLNEAREILHAASPFKAEPVDLVLWVTATEVRANDYNPNTVAPPEMDLLTHSVLADGYTQPVVVCPSGPVYEVVDGFHRHRVGRENAEVSARVQGYLPVVSIKEDRTGKRDRMAATVRHNRARGKHAVDKMSAIVLDLARRKWSDDTIAKELGMEPDEVLRLKQLGGVAAAFADREFSRAWEPQDDEAS